jgi:hypothetical protein
MASESELRDRFREGSEPSGKIDVDAVLRRARARRRPRVILAGAGSVLAIAAIAVPATIGSFASPITGTALVAGGNGGDESGYSQPESAPAPDSDGGGPADAALDRPPAEKLNLCSAPVAEVAPAENGLVLSVEPVTASAGDHGIPTIVTMTNTGAVTVSGTTPGLPSMTLSRGDITLWHSNGPQTLIAVEVDLAPGESMQYPATFEPVRCAAEDDSAETFRADLPELGPGVYQLSAAIDFTRNDGSFVDLVTGPAVRVTLD